MKVLTIVAIIILIIFVSYFLNIRIRMSRDLTYQSEPQPKQIIETEELPPSSANARYEEMRYAFLTFAKFFLLVKRPFGLKENINKDSVHGTILGGNDLGKQFSIKSPETCTLMRK